MDRSSRFVILARVEDSTAYAILESFTQRLRTLPKSYRPALLYDQHREMALHQVLERNTGIHVYFDDPHSPWQSSSNENTNGLLRQYFSNATDLSEYSQRRLTQAAGARNNQPRKSLGFRTPDEVLAQQITALNSCAALRT